MPRTNSKFKIQNSKLLSGLTLIELLVVIAIIGILASLATFTYQESQAKSRDSRRKSDLDALKKALELAKQDSAGSYSYPSCRTYDANGRCQLIADTSGANGATNPDLIGSNYSYIKEVPMDPKTNAGYIYMPTGASANCTVGTCNNFKLLACLENTKDPSSDVAKGGSNDSFCGTSTTSYTINNL